MAVVLKNGNYIKLLLDRCYIDINGVHIAYKKYKSEEERLFEKEHEIKFNNLLCNISDYIENTTRYLENKLGKIENIKSEEELQNRLSEEDKEKLSIIRQLNTDLNTILQYEYSGEELDKNKLNQLTILEHLGYNSDIIRKTHINNSHSIKSGVYTNQRFTYNDMYKELKKIFGKDVIKDC